jgi:hypothetical protein
MKDEGLARYAEGFCHVNIIFGPLFYDARKSDQLKRSIKSA